MLNQLIGLVTRVTLGKEMALAVLLLKLIREALQTQEVKNIAVFVYRKLPAAWRHPQGPATEAEFVTMVKNGEAFARSIHTLATR